MVNCIGTGTAAHAHILCQHCKRFAPAKASQYTDAPAVPFDDTSESCEMFVPIRHYSLGFVFDKDDIDLINRNIDLAHDFMSNFGDGVQPRDFNDENYYFGKRIIK